MLDDALFISNSSPIFPISCDQGDSVCCLRRVDAVKCTECGVVQGNFSGNLLKSYINV